MAARYDVIQKPFKREITLSTRARTCALKPLALAKAVAIFRMILPYDTDEMVMR